jgi:hypothetical protein
MQEELANAMSVVPAPEPPQSNRGWFRPGDRRINREGRPKGKVALGSAVENRAPRADRLRRLLIPTRDLVWRLTQQNAPWFVGVHEDLEIVGARFDVTSDCVVLTVRSQWFPKIARGSEIPVYEPGFNGLRWRRR